jgi:hypothetical protein
MWLRQVVTRGVVAALAAVALTVLVAVRTRAAGALPTVYSATFAASTTVTGVLIAGMAVLVAFPHLKAHPRNGPAFRQTVRSFAWTISYSAFLSVALLVGQLVPVTPDGWTALALFTPLFGFVFLTLLLTGLVKAIAHAMEL